MLRKNIEYSLPQGSIAELRAHFLERRLSVEEAVNWCLSRIKVISQSGAIINAVREVLARAIEDARRADQ